MPKKVLGFAINVLELKDLDFVELEKVMRVKLNKSHREELLATLNSYLANAAIFKQAPTVALVRKHSEKIEKHAHVLARLLGDSSELGQAAVGRCWPWRSMADPHRVTLLLYELAGNAKASRLDLPRDKAGRPENAYLAPFVAAIGRIYDVAGGKGQGVYKTRIDGTYQGALLDGICCLLNQGKKTHWRNTVAQVIEDWRQQGDHEKYKKPNNWP